MAKNSNIYILENLTSFKLDRTVHNKLVVFHDYEKIICLSVCRKQNKIIQTDTANIATMCAFVNERYRSIEKY